MTGARTKKARFEMRCSVEEKLAWTEAAGHLSLAEWLSRVANEEAARLLAEGRDREFVKQERLEVARAAFPQAVPGSALGKRTYKPDFK